MVYIYAGPRGCRGVVVVEKSQKNEEVELSEVGLWSIFMPVQRG